MPTYRNLGYNSFLIRSIKAGSTPTVPTEPVAAVENYKDLDFDYSLTHREMVLPTFGSEWNLPQYSAAEIRAMFPPYSISWSSLSSYIGQDLIYWKWIDDESTSSANVTGMLSASSFTDSQSQWINETNVYTDDSNYTNSDDPTPYSSTLELYGWNCNIPAGATVDGLVFYFTCAAATDSGSTSLLKYVQVTWDGGTSWSTYIAAVPFPIWSANFTTTKQVYQVGAADENWQHTWTIAQINSNTDFGLRFAADWATDEVPNVYHVGLKVYYTPA